MQQLTGALAGWRRTRTDHGIILSLQIAASADDVRSQRLGRVDVALNERQLRSLARDLVRAAEQRDIQVFARKPWWRKGLERLKRLRRAR